jgi:hypothetical protein
MPIDERKANWRFEAQWALPAHKVGSTHFTDKYKLLEELDFIKDIIRFSRGPMASSRTGGFQQ